MFVRFNPNPDAARVGDCAVRAMCKATGQTWEDTYIDLCLYGLIARDMPSANQVWGRFLHDRGFKKYIVPYCPDCTTLRRFADEHKTGVYVVALNGHVVAVVNGDYFDTWDSGEEVPLYYWMKGEKL